MNGQAEKIKRTERTPKERGLPAGSFFEAVFFDGSTITELEANWSDMAEERRVEYFGGTKTVMVCVIPLARISAHHEGLRASIEVPEGYLAYQAVHSETVISEGKKENRVLGRAVGIVRDGAVVEEQFVNGISHEVVGRRN